MSPVLYANNHSADVKLSVQFFVMPKIQTSLKVARCERV